MIKKRGFTLIESLAVIAIIGVLATLVTVLSTRAQQQARDTKRKSDLYALSQGFEARALDKTCNSAGDVGKYPGITLGATDSWVRADLLSEDESCNGFSQYLSRIPTDPRTEESYYFTLSPDARHFRLASTLERPSDKLLEQCTQDSRTWELVYDGQQYDCVDSAAIPSGEYLYVIGN